MSNPEQSRAGQVYLSAAATPDRTAEALDHEEQRGVPATGDLPAGFFAPPRMGETAAVTESRITKRQLL